MNSVPAVHGRPLHGGVDRNYVNLKTTAARERRPLHGGVDRNTCDSCGCVINHSVAPCTGAWIETIEVAQKYTQGGSPPARGRGSKRLWQGEAETRVCRPLHGGVDRNSSPIRRPSRRRVAPCTGAWIETMNSQRRLNPSDVAPCTGAWIETLLSIPDMPDHAQVAPCTGAWIETNPASAALAPRRVAPCTGAWIETVTSRASRLNRESPPARGRGSKPDSGYVVDGGIASPPARGRGSKLEAARTSISVVGRPLHGGVDRNRSIRRRIRHHGRRPLHGGVDRNPSRVAAARYLGVSPPARGRGSKQRQSSDCGWP